MVTYSPAVMALVDSAIAHIERTSGNIYTLENFSPVLLLTLDNMEADGVLSQYSFGAGSLTFFTHDALSQEYPSYFSLIENFAHWYIADTLHRAGDQPAAIQDGYLTWKQHHAPHRVNGPAYEKDTYAIHPSVIPSGFSKTPPTETFFLFGCEMTEQEHFAIVTLHRNKGIALEIAFLMVMNDIDDNTWQIDNTLPVNWQVKALQGKQEKLKNEFWVNNWLESERTGQAHWMLKYSENVWTDA